MEIGGRIIWIRISAMLLSLILLFFSVQTRSFGLAIFSGLVTGLIVGWTFAEFSVIKNGLVIQGKKVLPPFDEYRNIEKFLQKTFPKKKLAEGLSQVLTPQQKRKEWMHEIVCRMCKRKVLSRYKNLCGACYFKLLREKRKVKK